MSYKTTLKEESNACTEFLSTQDLESYMREVIRDAFYAGINWQKEQTDSESKKTRPNVTTSFEVKGFYDKPGNYTNDFNCNGAVLGNLNRGLATQQRIIQSKEFPNTPKVGFRYNVTINGETEKITVLDYIKEPLGVFVKEEELN